MPRAHVIPEIRLELAIRLWLTRQGLAEPRGARFTRAAFSRHLESTGALQMDSINVLDRAHYLTLWSRFGEYDRPQVDDWVYRDRIAYEYWGHEASILPISHMPFGLRRMRGFPSKRWLRSSWWQSYETSPASKRRVLRRLREEGPLESRNFEQREGEFADGRPGGAMPMAKEDARSLKLLWHGGKVAICDRRGFRCVYDLSGRYYPQAAPVTSTEAEDSWLLIGLSGHGVASESHLINYFTAGDLDAKARKQVLARNLKRRRVVEVRISDRQGTFYALPEHLETLSSLSEPEGTTLLSPFDSLLWSRKRVEEFLGFRYRVEIYVPASKRTFGYYVLPILHDGRLVGRLDPKLHRERSALEIKSIHLEPSFKRDTRFEHGLAVGLRSLAAFVGADQLELPRKWRVLG